MTSSFRPSSFLPDRPAGVRPSLTCFLYMNSDFYFGNERIDALL